MVPGLRLFHAAYSNDVKLKYRLDINDINRKVKSERYYNIANFSVTNRIFILLGIAKICAPFRLFAVSDFSFRNSPKNKRRGIIHRFDEFFEKYSA